MSHRALLKIADQLALRLESFKKIANQARERGERVDLAPQELWEIGDQSALDAYRAYVNQNRGSEPLPFNPAPASVDHKEVSNG